MTLDVLKLPKKEVGLIMGLESEIRNLIYAGISPLNNYLGYPSRGYNRSAPGLHRLNILRVHDVW